MTIDYSKRDEEMILDCDICVNTEGFHGTWQDCINQAKREGWRLKKHEGEWYHFCCDECLKKL